ncbi:MAG TPA: DUF3048 domain-containing protein [Actinomycetales bacterium]|nr:DUF3048 domain-containing protein [Actinomycetales bacterium]
MKSAIETHGDGRGVRRTWAAAAGVTAIGLALAACSGSKSPAPKASPTQSVVTSSPSIGPTEPLTGKPVKDAAALNHAAVAIKISDVPESQPEVGVDRADIVFVEPVGVSYTRLAAVFHSDLPKSIGPVRSVRPVDAPLLGPLAPVFGNTMGADWVLRYVDENSDVDDLGTLKVRGTGAYVLDHKRVSPNHVFAVPQVLLKLSDHKAPPKPYFQYASSAAGSSASSSGTAGTSAVVSYGPRYDVSWSYDTAKQQYLRKQPWGNHTMADGTQVHATNVLILRVESKKEKIGSGSGQAVPVLNLINATGDLVALSGGKAVKGTWQKGEPNEPFVLKAADGSTLELAPGNTWVELPTPAAAVTVK